jgi:hypothetical protein
MQSNNSEKYIKKLAKYSKNSRNYPFVEKEVFSCY